MLRRKNSRDKKPPTEEEFLKIIPTRGSFEWKINEKGLVEIKVEKFKSKLGKSLCRLLRREPTFTANLDKIGSIVWQECNGKKSVRDIVEVLKKKFPEEKDIDQRLYLFLQQMQNLGYINI